MRRSLLLVGMLTSACMINVPVSQQRDTLQARASFDMQCPLAQLRITELDNATAGVEGCGHRETYIYNYTSATWVLNSPGTSPPDLGEPAPSPQPAGVPAGSPPGTLLGSSPGSSPGAPIGSPPGTPPGGWNH